MTAFCRAPMTQSVTRPLAEVIAQFMDKERHKAPIIGDIGQLNIDHIIISNAVIEALYAQPQDNWAMWRALFAVARHRHQVQLVAHIGWATSLDTMSIATLYSDNLLNLSPGQAYNAIFAPRSTLPALYYVLGRIGPLNTRILDDIIANWPDNGAQLSALLRAAAAILKAQPALKGIPMFNIIELDVRYLDKEWRRALLIDGSAAGLVNKGPGMPTAISFDTAVPTVVSFDTAITRAMAAPRSAEEYQKYLIEYSTYIKFTAEFIAKQIKRSTEIFKSCIINRVKDSCDESILQMCGSFIIDVGTARVLYYERKFEEVQKTIARFIKEMNSV
jgi:hypothetical protein